MLLIRWFLVAVLLIAVAAGWFFWQAAKPPQLLFAKVERAEVASTVVTNGQVEPLDGAELRGAAPGKIQQISAVQGQRIAGGSTVLVLEHGEAEIQLRDAEAALVAAQVRLRQADAGGNPLRRKELDGSLAEAQLAVRHAEEEAARVRRLVGANAATARELELQEQQVAIAAERLRALEAQKQVLLSDADHEEARAAVVTAQARVDAARRRVADASLRSPRSGILYEFGAKPGAWVQPGDLLGRIGDLSTLRILVYVDEPELGKVREGLPVTIRWDALPGKSWKGVVDRVPTRIQSYGTRQVGEVVCRIQNPDGDLIPGANVNAEIISAKEASALVVPKQCIRRRLGAEGVWKLDGAVLRWQPVRVGISSITDAQILDGLAEGDAVALLVDRELRDGMEVLPVYP